MSHYHHLSIKERESILKLSAEGKGNREISRALGRSAGTISRELKRNNGKEGYWPTEAKKKYRKRRKKCCRKRILDDPETKAFVQQKILEEQWSPEQIANRAKLENSPYQVSHPTIYRAIYAGRLEVRKRSHGERGLARKLRHRGKTCRKKGEEETRGKLRISHPIEERPQAANDRSELGHWEADTVAGKTGSSCLITLACRKSRLLLSLKIPKKTSAHVRDGMIQLLSALPADLVRSVTPVAVWSLQSMLKSPRLSMMFRSSSRLLTRPGCAALMRTRMALSGSIAPRLLTWSHSILLSSPLLHTRSIFVPANVSARDLLLISFSICCCT